MSALPVLQNYSSKPSSEPAQFSHRVVAENRRLASDVLWVRFSADQNSGLQNFTPALVDEFHTVLDSIRRPAGTVTALPLGGGARYTVIQSTHPDYFSVGGDLRFFRSCIAAGDDARLRQYSISCLDLMHGLSTRLKGENTSISLVQGRALGGGFEMALSTDYLIAEERSSFGFPEIMFGLFPCTGAMGLLANKVGARQAEKMMTNKRIYSADELLQMGIIDEVCSDGEGEQAVERYVAEHTRRQKALLKVQKSRYMTAPLDYDEGARVVEDWVETAMNLSTEEIRTMEMLILMQSRDAAPGH